MARCRWWLLVGLFSLAVPLSADPPAGDDAIEYEREPVDPATADALDQKLGRPRPALPMPAIDLDGQPFGVPPATTPQPRPTPHRWPDSRILLALVFLGVLSILVGLKLLIWSEQKRILRRKEAMQEFILSDRLEGWPPTP